MIANRSLSIEQELLKTTCLYFMSNSSHSDIREIIGQSPIMAWA